MSNLKERKPVPAEPPVPRNWVSCWRVPFVAAASAYLMGGRLPAMSAAKAEVVAFLELAVVHSQRCGQQKSQEYARHRVHEMK